MNKKKFEDILGHEDPKNLIDPEVFLQEVDWKRKSSDIASRILDYLDENENLTQRNLAEKIGLSAQRVSKILSGGQNLTLSTIGKIEKALNMELIRVPGFEDFDEWERSLQYEEGETDYLPDEFYEKSEASEVFDKPKMPEKENLEAFFETYRVAATGNDKCEEFEEGKFESNPLAA